MSENKRWVVYRCAVCESQIYTKPELKLNCDCNKKRPRMYAVGFENNKIPEEVAGFFKEKNLLSLFVKELDKRIAGEDFLKKALTLQILGGRLVENGNPTSFNALIQSASGSGKDWIAKNIIELLPNSYVEHKTRISEKALNYWHPAEKEPRFSWDGMVIYLEDVSDRILNSEVLKTMTSGGSSVSIVIDGELQEMKINGNPCFILTGAYVEPNSEICRRIQIYNATESESQTQKVLEKQSEIAKNGLPKYDNNLRWFNYCLRRVNAKVLFASEIALSFPSQLLARTTYGQFIDFIRCSVALNQYCRDKDSEGQVIATSEDYEIAKEIFLGLYAESQGLHRLTSSQKFLLSYFEECKDRELTASEIFSEIGNKLYTQINNLIKALNSLCQKGFLKIGTKEVHNRVADSYSLAEPKSKFKLPSYNELFEVNKVSEISDITKVSKVSKENNKEALIQLTSDTLLIKDTLDTTRQLFCGNDFEDEKLGLRLICGQLWKDGERISCPSCQERAKEL